MSCSKVIPSRLMANTKSAIKRIRRIKKQTSVMCIRDRAYLPKLNSELMKIAKTGVIKKGNASRNISRITRKISTL